MVITTYEHTAASSESFPDLFCRKRSISVRYDIVAGGLGRCLTSVISLGAYKYSKRRSAITSTGLGLKHFDSDAGHFGRD